MTEFEEKPAPVKPTIPLFLSGGLALWGSCALVLTQASFFLSLSLVLSITATLACALLVFALVRYRIFWAVSLLVGALLGLQLGYLQAQNFYTTQSHFQAGEVITGEFLCESDVAQGMYGPSVSAQVTCDGYTLKVKVNLSEGTVLLRGDRFSGVVTLSKVTEDSSYTFFQGIHWYGKASYVEPLEQESLLSPLYQLREGEINLLEASLVQASEDWMRNAVYLFEALICGYRSNINETTLYSSYRVAGLAHMIAVSGAHLVIVDSFVLALLKLLRCSKRKTIMVRFAFILAYLVCAGVPISGVRAGAMTLTGMSSFLAKRRPDSLNALALCLIFILITDPFASCSISLLLSAGSTLGIVLFASLIHYWMRRMRRIRLPRFVGDALCLTFSSSIVSLPLTAALFSQLSLIAPLSNVIVTPLFAPLCILGLVTCLGTYFFPWMGYVLLPVSILFAGFVNGAVGLLARVPYASISCSVDFLPMLLLVVAVSACLLIIWDMIKLRLWHILTALGIAIVAAAVPFFSSFSSPEIIMLDVGQGDSFLVRSDGETFLVDTGNRSSDLKEALATHGVVTLDGLFITHSDSDHCGCVEDVFEVCYVKNVYVAADMLQCTCKNCTKLMSLLDKDLHASVTGIEAGDTLTCGNFSLECLWPSTFADEGSNADSLVFEVTLDIDDNGTVDYTALLTGDAESDQLEEILSNEKTCEELEDIDLLKVGHHGSRVSLTEDILDVLSPEVAFISVGANNSYGHPKENILKLLQNAKVDVYRSDVYGDVTCTFTTNGLRITTEY